MGNFKLNYFDGDGEFNCYDGRKYVGEFKQGMRHGYGTQWYLRTGDAGDPKRLFIGVCGHNLCQTFYANDFSKGRREFISCSAA